MIPGTRDNFPSFVNIPQNIQQPKILAFPNTYNHGVVKLGSNYLNCGRDVIGFEISPKYEPSDPTRFIEL